MNTLPATTSVAIVGAGPAGLTAAIALADADIDFVLLDRQAEGANTSRACVVHARTLEVLQQIGIADELHRRGVIVPEFVVHELRRPIAHIRFDGLPTAFPYTLMVPQNVTEEVLLARLRKAGGEVHRPYTVTGITQTADHAEIDYTDAAGNAGTLRAEYVVAADGMHSVLREQSGIGFTGASYPESFVLADVRMSWPDPRTQVSLHWSPEGVTVVSPLPGPDDHYRVVATVAEAPEKPNLHDVQTILEARRPNARVQVHELVWSSRFRVHHRLADHYRAGRVLLAGDAAHVHSPAGGQGMNTGIQDAAALGALLVRVLRGEPDSLLDDYETTRRPVALNVVSMTDRITRMATLRAKPARMLRNAAASLITRIPAVRHKIAYTLAELGYR